jgi:phosphatidylglycerol:prolipoprotein diacylglycerol transferase
MAPIIHLGPYTIYSFGFLLGLAICSGTYAFSLYCKVQGIPANIWAFSLTVVPIGFLAARLDDAYMNHFRNLSHHSGSFTAQIANGGLTYYGGLVTSLVAWVVFILVCRLPFLRTIDGLFCVGLAFGVGRVGCFLDGDGDYGVASNLPWAMSFPHGTVPTIVRVHPTMLYTTIWELAVFVVLWRLSNPQRRPSLRPGTLFGLYLILTGFGRFMVECLSRNHPVAFGLREAQLVSLALAGIGAMTLVAVHRMSRPHLIQTHEKVMA